MGLDPGNGLRHVVDSPKQTESCLSNFDLYIDVDPGILGLSGKRRHCLPAKDTDPGFSIHVHRCGVADLPGEKAGQKAASAAAGWADR